MISDFKTKRTQLATLQVNMGNVCNQACAHCHVGASADGKKIMSRKVINDILEFLAKHPGLVLDITGGAPELNPDFVYFIIKARPLVQELIVRSNLTVLLEPEKEFLPELFKTHGVHLICSLPCYGQENVDSQRGKGVFKKSIQALKVLNQQGYAQQQQLNLDLVYNPAGNFLPPRQGALEQEYKHNLKTNYDVDFNRLVTITNVPIKRFKDYLDSRGEYDGYLQLLRDNFNPSAAENIMCRRFLSVGFDGKLYDCDFNQSLEWALKDKQGNFLTIDKINADDLEQREIMIGEHCLSCTAGYGSSCQGALTESEPSALGTRESVKTYYSKILNTTKDLKTSACCAIDAVPAEQKQILSNIHPEILSKFYGCGSPIPPLLAGRRVLDLGCGSGRDTYTIAKLVGEQGAVIGVDMTDEQLAVANQHLDYQMERFGFSRANVEFKKGYIENLQEIGIEDNSLDVVVSNCVINLSPDKPRVFAEIFRVLKPGGELYFSDIFTGRRISEEVKSDPILYGECLGGALYIEDFRRILRQVGCLDYRVAAKRRISLDNPEIEAKAGMIDFYSMTIRAFKLDNLEDICEDYGQLAKYLGNIPNHPHQFALDAEHLFIAQKPVLVCGNTAAMLNSSRYAESFEIIGAAQTHFGPFNCAPTATKAESEHASPGGGCC
ncbi:arsenosugar biosynthesis radical SAM (seleno)protein ArsS [Candidatus Omnitrophota bacterium]